MSTPSADFTEDVSRDRDSLAKLEQEVEGARCRLRASALLERLRSQQAPGLASGVDQLSLLAQSSAVARDSPFVLDDTGSFVCSALPAGASAADLTLVPFPPPLEAVPCKPQLFDVARNAVRLPDLTPHKKPERSASSIFGRMASGFFGR
mmetsp:Transcript_4005/g.10047  ORF Transcript_4005/g.10047 Transcript_4005/m.10047 type:complete len:150 (+) Transcript_4005:20-469(+)